MKPAGPYQPIPTLNLPRALPPTSFEPRVQRSPLHPMHRRSGTCNAANAGVQAPQRLRMLAATQNHAETTPPPSALQRGEHTVRSRAAPKPSLTWTQTRAPGAKCAGGWGDAGMQEPAAACSIPGGKGRRWG